MKFWIGVGVLKKKDDDYSQIILSPSQLEKTGCLIEDINIQGLDDRNFKKLRILFQNSQAADVAPS